MSSHTNGVITNGHDSHEHSAKDTGHTFLFSSESVGDGHPGNSDLQ